MANGQVGRELLMAGGNQVWDVPGPKPQGKRLDRKTFLRTSQTMSWGTAPSWAEPQTLCGLTAEGFLCQQHSCLW